MEISDGIRELIGGMSRRELIALVLDMLENERIPELPLPTAPPVTDPSGLNSGSIAGKVAAIMDDDTGFDDSYGEYGLQDEYPNEHAFNIMMQGLNDAFYKEAEMLEKTGDTGQLNSLLLTVAEAFRNGGGSLLEHCPEAGRDIADSIEDCVERKVPMDAFLF